MVAGPRPQLRPTTAAPRSARVRQAWPNGTPSEVWASRGMRFGSRSPKDFFVADFFVAICVCSATSAVAAATPATFTAVEVAV